MANNDMEAEVMQWREQRNQRLRTNERSWLGLAGLFWLKEGDNTFGSDASNDFVLPAGVPKKTGVFVFKDGMVTVNAEPKAKMTCNGANLPERPLRDDQQNEPDYLYLGHLILVVIKRGGSTLIRLWDIDSPARKEFKGMDFFPYRPELCFNADYFGYAPFKVVKTEDIIGEVHDTQMIGYIAFEYQGQMFRLDAENEGDGLFIAFKDKTNAKSTYAGGRYVTTAMPNDGKVVLDFNKAYNMPCAYALYATCNLATKENHLPIAIEAGEMKYKEDH